MGGTSSIMRIVKTDYPKMEVTPKTGNERFSIGKKELELDLLGFWRWSASDLIANTGRGVLAEYIVANALGVADKLRADWEAFDLETLDGIKIEVKSSSYVQSWLQTKPSTITFGIRQTKVWDPEDNKLKGQIKRHAQVYVFCLLAHKTQETLNPLDLDQWEFYIVPTSVLDKECTTQKTIGLERVKSLAKEAVKYDQIADAIAGLKIVKR